MHFLPDSQKALCEVCMNDNLTLTYIRPPALNDFHVKKLWPSLRRALWATAKLCLSHSLSLSLLYFCLLLIIYGIFFCFAVAAESLK